MNELGELLRRLRGKKSLREAAEKAGISHNYLSIVEKGTDPRSGSPIKPTPETIMSLSKAYNYSYEELMKIAGYLPGEENESYKKHPAEKLRDYLESGLTNDEIKKRMNFFVDEFMQLNDEQADEFIRFARWQLSETKKEPTASSSKLQEP